MAKEIQVGELKDSLSRIVREVEEQRAEVVIKNRGKSVAKLVPADAPLLSSFGHMRGSVTIHGDIVAPLEDEWEANVE